MAVAVTNSATQAIVNAFASAGSAKSNIGPNSASTQVRALVSDVAEQIKFNQDQTAWIALRDSAADGFTSVTMAQIDQTAVQLISEKVSDLKNIVEVIQASDIESDAQHEAITQFDILESELSALIGRYSVAKSATVTIKEEASPEIQSYLTPLTRVTATTESGSPIEFAALEISQRDFLNAFHTADQCPICQANAELALSGIPLSELGDEATYMGDTANYLSASGSGSAATTYNSSDLTSNSDTNTILSGYKWDDSSLSYSIYNKDNPVPFDYVPGLGLTNTVAGALTTSYNMWDYRSDVQLMFSEIADASGLTFEEIIEDPASGDVGDLRVAFSEGFSADGKGSAGAFAYYPSNSNFAGDIWFNATDSDNYDLSSGTKGFQRGIHEAGHALGLSHPHDAGSLDNSTLASIGEPEKDGYRYSVMTYNQGGTGSSNIYDRNLDVDFSVSFSGNAASVTFSNSRVMPSTPMILDIEALEHLYGSSTANAGNTTHDVSLFGSAYLRTISDAGADETDTLDASTATRDSIINLTAGSLSSINVRSEADLVTDLEDAIIAAAATQGVSLTSSSSAVTTWTTYLTGTYLPFYDTYANPTADDGDASNGGSALYTGVENLAIARSATIENAIGGAGDDTITGNALANVITGNSGDDTIDGSGGEDVAIFSGNYADYSITNNGDGSYTIVDGTAARDGTDNISNVETFRFADIDYTVSSGSVFNTLEHRGGSNGGGGRSNVYYSAFNNIDFGKRIMAPHEVGALKAILYKTPGQASEILEEALKSFTAQKISIQQVIDQVKGGLQNQLADTVDPRVSISDPSNALEIRDEIRQSILAQVQDALEAQNSLTEKEVEVLLT